MANDKTPMLERESYIAGVEKAKALEAERTQRQIDRIAALVSATSEPLAPSLQAAKERSAARKAKYGEKPSTIVRVLVVPKGSVPRRGSWDEYFRLDDERRAAQESETSEHDA